METEKMEMEMKIRGRGVTSRAARLDAIVMMKTILNQFKTFPPNHLGKGNGSVSKSHIEIERLEREIAARIDVQANHSRAGRW